MSNNYVKTHILYAISLCDYDKLITRYTISKLYKKFKSDDIYKNQNIKIIFIDIKNTNIFYRKKSKNKSYEY